MAGADICESTSKADQILFDSPHITAVQDGAAAWLVSVMWSRHTS